MKLFDRAYGVVTVEGANHCDVKRGDGLSLLFGGYEVDTVWGKLGCPRLRVTSRYRTLSPQSRAASQWLAP